MIETIKKKLDNLSNMSEIEIMQTILEAITLTQTNLEFEKLRQVLPEEKFKNIESKLKDIMKNTYKPQLGWEEETLERLRKSGVKKSLFFFAKDGEEFALRRLDYTEMAKKINFEKIELESLVTQNFKSVVLEAVKGHRAYNVFHPNGIISGEEMRELLDSIIENLPMVIGEKQQAGGLNEITPSRIENMVKGTKIEGFRKAVNGMQIPEKRTNENEVSNNSQTIEG